MIATILVFLCTIFSTRAACFHCLSSDAHLAPTLRRQLKTQSDVFFWQIGTTQGNACSVKVNPMSPTIDGQICSKYSLCVTLQPNIHNTTFVVRGCLENVLRRNWRDDERLHKDGCYMVRSMPMYPNTDYLDYVICVCRGDYCNGEEPVDFVPGPVHFNRDTVLQLNPRSDELYVPGQRAQLEVNASATLLYWALLFILLFLLVQSV